MSTSELISLGMLIVAAIGVFSGAIFSVYRWFWNRRYGIRFTIKPKLHKRLYILGVQIRRNKTPIITSVGLWCKVEFYNISSEAKLITELLGYDNLSNPKPIYGFPVKDVHFEYEKDIPEEIVDIPLTLEAQHGLHFWVLLPINISDNLGEILFNLYGQKINSLPTFKRLYNRIPEVEKLGVKGIIDMSLPITDVSFTIDSIDFRYPLLNKRGGEVMFDPKFGTIPHNVYPEIFKFAKQSPQVLRDVFYVASRYYIVQAKIAGVRLLTRRLKIGNKTLWWEHLTL